jgi:two-component system chemotaxis response regulator CheY
MEILIADDSKMVRFMTVEALRGLGYKQITEANNVSEARNLMQGKMFDLIISDFNMPGETGLEFLRYVRATPKFEKIPFVLQTSEGDKKNIVAAVQAGVQAYIFKPVQKAILAQKLTELSKKYGFQAPEVPTA